MMLMAKPAAYIVAAATLLAPNDAFAAAGDAKLDEALSALWQQYKAKFIDPSGRVIDNANGGISHSEGQGYSMLLAERFGDKDAFAKAWLWTQQNLLVRPDRLAAWRWDPTSTLHVTDTNNATDGDLFMAWALSETGEKWNEPSYTRAAQEIADAVARADVAPSPFGPILKPAAAGFGAKDQRDGPVVNLSYWVFSGLETLHKRSEAADWNALAATGRKLIGKAQFGRQKLPSNWVALGGSAPAPAAAFPRLFGYDAIRIPLYLAWSGTAQDRSLLQPYSQIDLSVIDLDSGDIRDALSDPDYGAISALAGCVLHGTSVSPSSSPYQGQTYYPATLHLLALIAARDRGCLRL
jgi:endo-1,4-beta-D-glucanase Y